MDFNEIPKTILDKHPELINIYMAIKEYQKNQEIKTKCFKCNNTLSVIEVKETGTLWVKCGKGCTSYHSKKQKDSAI